MPWYSYLNKSTGTTAGKSCDCVWIGCFHRGKAAFREPRPVKFNTTPLPKRTTKTHNTHLQNDTHPAQNNFHACNGRGFKKSNWREVCKDYARGIRTTSYSLQPSVTYQNSLITQHLSFKWTHINMHTNVHAKPLTDRNDHYLEII